MRRLQALVHDAAQLAAQRVELDLVAQPRAEAGQCLRRVVAAAVEAAVDRRLTRARAGRNSAATASVDAATAKPDFPTASPISSTSPRYVAPSSAVSTP